MRAIRCGALLLFDVWGIFAVDWGGEVGGAVGRVVAAVEVLSGFFSVDEWGIFAVDWGERFDYGIFTLKFTETFTNYWMITSEGVLKI
ncbi:hypothetical protein OsJ_01262 [Oryza sativa Japonica Group]|uniref:Uncharacterized protein n=1 Tax=Oryza sativa subsp. japonica TaxID=39947 RepID=B9EV62_ORYSJ|nr:hypothetical protein OsJ_01262 [Oryza sativa Japonica Group]